MQNSFEQVIPGIHPTAQCNIALFSREEKDIVKQWANEWYVTRAGQVSISNSDYEYIFVKPTASYEEAMGISREVVVVFCDYSNFEARSLEVYDEVCSGIHDARIERTCYVIVSKCAQICDRLREFLTNHECQVIIPFAFDEFTTKHNDPYFIRNRFRDSFKSRDLFDYSDPLKKDFYFFGRNEIVAELIDKHRENLNSGLFGLRKTGKTSIIYDVIRKLQNTDSIGVFIDCQSPSFNMRRWNSALYYVLSLVSAATLEPVVPEEKFTETDAEKIFLEELCRIRGSIHKSILLMFDEIENITFEKSGVSHWRDGLDFVYFWQAIRSAYQKATAGVFTFCILGTNAKCVEEPLIHGVDNPIFNIFQPKYIPGFTVQQTREMVRKLGKLMGIKFDETIYAKLTEDYGGHPFLVRRVCSMVAQQYPDRPVTIDRTKYIAIRDKFNRESDYFKMLLEVLKQFYDDEYEMLIYLAQGDIDNFKYFADGDYSYIKHLMGYGIIKEVDGVYDFQIDSIKTYLLRVTQFAKINMTPEEKWAEVCTTRCDLERRLRAMVRKILKIALKSEANAKDEVIRKVLGNKAKYHAMSYVDLFDSRKSEIYLKNLQTLINAHWEYFADYFNNQECFVHAMDVLNKEGRFDAHATIPNDTEIDMIRSAASHIEGGIKKFEDE